jgi:hypothetical protein
MNDKAKTAKMINESIEVMGKICNDWECKFLESMRDRVQKQISLSTKQLKKLSEIYEKVCDSPY